MLWGNAKKHGRFSDRNTHGLWCLIVIHTRRSHHLVFAQYLFISLQPCSWKVHQVQCGCFEIFRQDKTTHCMVSQQDTCSCHAPQSPSCRKLESFSSHLSSPHLMDSTLHGLSMPSQASPSTGNGYLQ
jgi:hypothetical protein